MIEQTITLPSINKIKTIYHVSDIHIRLLYRHKEYKAVFDNLYTEIKKDTDNSIIYVAGDLLHAKLDLSPEAVQLAIEFLKSLSDICPTIVIAGNHDCNVNNLDRLDSIKPLVDSLNHQNLYYLRDTGIYHINNIDFIVFSVFDENPFENIDFTNSAQIRIGLYHGAVNNSILQNGIKIKETRINNTLFDGLDIAMLGDIHQYQILQDYDISTFTIPIDKNELNDYFEAGYRIINNELVLSHPKMLYASSLIQQNYSEDLRYHGVVKWDIETKKHKYINIKNKQGFCTFEIMDSDLVIPNFTIPELPKVRILSQSTKLTRIKEIVAELQTKYKFKDYTLIDSDNNVEFDGNLQFDKIEDLTDVNYQNSLIIDYLKNKYEKEDFFTTDFINKIIVQNEWLNNELDRKQTTTLKANKIKIKEMWFSNLFNFGENNYINFDSLTGLIGLFNRNASGKTSFLFILLFMLQDKTTRTKKALDLLNIDKDWFYGKLKLSINDKIFFIEKSGTKIQINNKNAVKVNVDFYYIDDKNEKVSLNGEQRRETINIIRTYLGEFKHLIMTSFSLQNNNDGLISESQTDRKQLLSSFLGIDIFEHLNKLAYSEIKHEQTVLKDFKNKNLNTELTEFGRELKSNTTLYETTQQNIKTLNDNKENLISDISTIKSKIDTNIKSFNITKLNSELKKLNIDLSNTTLTLKTANSNVLKHTSDAKIISNKLHQFDVNQLKIKKKKLDTAKVEFNKNNTILTSLKYKKTTQEEKLKNLKVVEYDNNCNFCMNNVFVKDAIATKTIFKETELLYTSQSIHVNNLHLLVNSGNSIIQEIKDYNTANKAKEKLKYTYETNQSNIEKFKTKIEFINTKIKTITKNIETYKKQQNQIELNVKYQIDIDNKLKLKKDITTQLNKLQKQLTETHSNITHFEYTIADITRQLREVRVHEDSLFIYEKYIEAIDKDGLQYELIRQIIPKLQNEVNNILVEINAGFTLQFLLDDKDIDINIVYKNRFNTDSWNLDLTSGMERFVSSIAVRVALTKVSNLPSYNFLIVDEGFSNLDSENLVKMDNLFEYLTNFFDFIIIISHLDAMRDVTEKFIQIDKTPDNYAVIKHD